MYVPLIAGLGLAIFYYILFRLIPIIMNLNRILREDDDE
jgi:phosphotransferase system  glucose/maltose/N-acetylglucosamine-specific IIC component